MTKSRELRNKPPQHPLKEIDRRRFLRYVGAGATALAGAQMGLFPLGCAGGKPAGGERVGWVDDHGRPDWISPPYPVPLPGEVIGQGVGVVEHAVDVWSWPRPGPKFGRP